MSLKKLSGIVNVSYSPVILDFKDYSLFFWYANNAGRGTNNCTICKVLPGSVRASRSKNQTNVIAKTTCSAFMGHPNLSKNTLKRLNIY